MQEDFVDLMLGDRVASGIFAYINAPGGWGNQCQDGRTDQAVVDDYFRLG